MADISTEQDASLPSKGNSAAGLLHTISSPADLRKLAPDRLPRIAAEIREFMVDNVSRSGGHLAPSLGTVDLTIALHYSFDTPADKLVWDVGHQTYAHKILTGRRDTFNTLRQFGGISGFPRLGESEYDAASVGHASTSISLGLGMAVARDLTGGKFNVVSIIGDGSLSGGLAYEGLNNLGSRSTGMIVVLNDNEMSIARNVGAMSRYLTRVITDRRYNTLKTEIWELLGNLSNVGKRIRSLVGSVDDALKHFVIPGKLFQDMGLRYFGPVNGHNINEMVEVFKFARSSQGGPILIHVITKKGKGYRFAEDDATQYHGIGSFSPSTGASSVQTRGKPTFSTVFGDAITELGARYPEIVAITAAMPDGTGLKTFRDSFPERFFDVGIAEEHAVTFAAGLALQGRKPVVALYSTFLQRTYDQILHDIALDGLHVVFCIDRAGLVGDDGPTHHGAFDLSFLRTVPGAVIMAPRHGNELRDMLYTALQDLHSPVFIRYPRGECGTIESDGEFRSIPLYTPETVRQGTGCALISAGHMFSTASLVCGELDRHGIRPTLVNARFVKPLDIEFYTGLLARHTHVVTLEQNALTGGFGTGILELAAGIPSSRPGAILRFGYPDAFVTHGNTALLEKELGIDPASITRRILEFLGK